jgi:hypothetical protein
VASLTQKPICVARRRIRRLLRRLKPDELKSNFLHLSKFSEKVDFAGFYRGVRVARNKRSDARQKKRQKRIGEEISRPRAFAYKRSGLLSDLEAD